MCALAARARGKCAAKRGALPFAFSVTRAPLPLLSRKAGKSGDQVAVAQLKMDAKARLDNLVGVNLMQVGAVIWGD